ncbi:MAG: hypothetical protein AAF585_17490 [Verrucomicrobiota bacterium]
MILSITGESDDNGDPTNIKTVAALDTLGVRGLFDEMVAAKEAFKAADLAQEEAKKDRKEELKIESTRPVLRYLANVFLTAVSFRAAQGKTEFDEFSKTLDQILTSAGSAANAVETKKENSGDTGSSDSAAAGG